MNIPMWVSAEFQASNEMYNLTREHMRVARPASFRPKPQRRFIGGPPTNTYMLQV